MGILFLACNLACLAVLVRKRYWQLFPCFCAALAATCWQAGATFWVDVADRESWIHYWVPGERCLLALTAIALGEAVWRSVEKLSIGWRELTLAGLVLCAGGLTAWRYTSGSGDWYDQFLIRRTWLYLAFALFSFVGCWVGLMINRKLWPRAARMHLSLYAVLMIAHVWFSDINQWGHSHGSYRLTAMLCCAGWIMNAGFRAEELREIAAFLRADALRLAGLQAETARAAGIDSQIVAPVR